MDFSMSDTNTSTLGVVGAAVMHGPNSASAFWADRHPRTATTVPQIGRNARRTMFHAFRYGSVHQRRSNVRQDHSVFCSRIDRWLSAQSSGEAAPRVARHLGSGNDDV